LQIKWDYKGKKCKNNYVKRDADALIFRKLVTEDEKPLMQQWQGYKLLRVYGAG
jgi:hypothetical protein